ncbi:UNVERIFIED_CONTAM: hypothetical protein Slati_2458000 [Sesamum latifolium]|uniref:Reverse transcriptase Ty1/copia-type domain-containing protein n=1 Tax=Sesamum latifolium TaxID=2727402 RepID=A0AAW2WDB0_9LAMI
MTKKPFVGQSAIANGLLDLVHTDVCGPLSAPARRGFSYFITFINDHSRYGYVYLMRYKSEAFERFKEYRLEVENQTSHKIKALRRTEVGFPSDSRCDEVLIVESSEEPQHDSTTSFEPPVYTDGVPVLRRSTRESRVPESRRISLLLERNRKFVISKKVHLRPQASFRSWNTHFDKIIRGYDFIKNDYDPCIYKKISGSSVAYLVLYVDDILLIGNDIKMLGDIKAWLPTQFSMKDMGLEEIQDGALKTRTPSHEAWVKLSKKQSPKTDKEFKRMSNFPYASAVGSIQYVVQCTKPDVAYALSLDDDDAKSQSDFVFKLNGGVVAWKSFKKDTTADSTAELNTLQLRKLQEGGLDYIQELGVVPSIAESVVIFCDNNETIAQAKELRSHHRSKHILRCYHLLREMVSRGDCRMDRVSSAEKTVDPLTKPMSQVAHTQHLDKMGLRSMGDWI